MAEAQLRRFLEVAHNEIELLWWLLMCDAGLRVGEVRRLHFGDLEGRSVRVRGKGRKVRLVPVTSRIERTCAECRRRYGCQDAHRVCNITGRQVQRRFDRCLMRSGIRKEKLCPHSLRHTFATRLLTAGVDIHRVGVLLGHASTMTTVGYLHTNEEALNDARDRLERLNAGAGSPRPNGEERDAVAAGPPSNSHASPTVSPYPEIQSLASGVAPSESGDRGEGPLRRGNPLERLSHLL